MSTTFPDGSPTPSHWTSGRQWTGRRHHDKTKGAVSKPRKRQGSLVPPLDIIHDLAATAALRDRLMGSTSQQFAWNTASQAQASLSVVSSTQTVKHPSCNGLNVTSLRTAALCSHRVELLPILQNLSIDVNQDIVCFLNKFFPTPFVRDPSSCVHQNNVLVFECHILHAVN